MYEVDGLVYCEIYSNKSVKNVHCVCDWRLWNRKVHEQYLLSWSEDEIGLPMFEVVFNKGFCESVFLVDALIEVVYALICMDEQCLQVE